MSYTGTPLYEVSKYIAKILKPYGKQKEQHTNNSKSFSTFIRQQTIEPDEIMISFDVTSLYTTIPIDQALLIIEDLLQHDNKLTDRAPLTPNQILDLLSIILGTTYFKFNDQFYQQTDGAAMGSPTSAIVSEIYMQALEMTAITTADHPSKIWERHADDVFSVIQRNYLQELLHHINSLHPQTQFTKEEEQDSILPFLDTLVQRNPDKTISVKVYRKPTHTNQYLNYTSQHSTPAKQSVITALFDRADNIVSSEKDKEEEKQHILAALQRNGYPRDFIMKTIKQHNRRKERTTEVTEAESKPNKKINVPYIQGASEQLRRTFNKYNIKTTFYTPTILRSLLSKPKDPIPKEDRNNVIYQLHCKDCEAVYVGETKRTLNIRNNEHISAVKSASQRSHTAEHCWKYNHDFDWNNKRVLDFEKNWKTRIIKEAIYSEENKHHINGVSFKLPSIWKPILQKNKEKKNKLENSTAKNTSPSNSSPDTSAMQTNQSAMTTEHFDLPAST